MNKLVKYLAFALAVLAVRVDDRDRGATATEYALLVALIAIVIAIAVTFFGSNLSVFFNNIGATVASWT